jgi:hypothetical protein
MRPCRRGGMAGTAAQTVLTKARQPPRAKLLIIANGKSGKALRYKRPYESRLLGLGHVPRRALRAQRARGLSRLRPAHEVNRVPRP